MYHGVECSILDVVAIFDKTFKVFSHGFSTHLAMESTWNSPWNPWWGWNEKIAEDSPKSVPYGIYQGV